MILRFICLCCPCLSFPGSPTPVPHPGGRQRGRQPLAPGDPGGLSHPPEDDDPTNRGIYPRGSDGTRTWGSTCIPLLLSSLISPTGEAEEDGTAQLFRQQQEMLQKTAAEFGAAAACRVEIYTMETTRTRPAQMGCGMVSWLLWIISKYGPFGKCVPARKELTVTKCDPWCGKINCIRKFEVWENKIIYSVHQRIAVPIIHE